MVNSSHTSEFLSSPAVLGTIAITGLTGFLLGYLSANSFSSSSKTLKIAGRRRKSKRSSKSGSKQQNHHRHHHHHHHHHNKSTSPGLLESQDNKGSKDNTNKTQSSDSISLLASNTPNLSSNQNSTIANSTSSNKNQDEDDSCSCSSDYSDSDYTDEEEDDDEDDPRLDAAPGAFAYTNEECKMVLIIRTDLKMTKGKVAAQCAHAALACFKSVSRSNPEILARWERMGQAKITLKADSEEELLTLYASAMSLDVTAKYIRDAGRTQIASGSMTVLGLGPAPVSVINKVSGHLKLY